MKQFKTTGTLLVKSIFLAGLLASCNNDEIATPAEPIQSDITNQNAKISPLTRLTKEGERTIQYVKSGKFFGRIAKVDYGISTNYYATYTYDNNNPAGDLWISKKLYHKASNTFIQEWKYKVTNGLCVASEDLAQGYSFTYTYNAQNQLDEVKLFVQGNVSATLKYSYLYNAATNSYRLNKISESSTKLGPNLEFTFAYTPIPDKAPLNFEIYNIDRYLPAFGTASDVLVEKRVEKSLAYPANPASNFYHTYTTDVDGLVNSRKIEHTTGNTPPSGSGNTEILKYSTAWQGI